MNAQEIKNILIAYLRATNREIRIYQEKSIGDAVCDLMSVTDCLTGYEIKSDLDNYQRLGRQIKAYDRFFEQCYIVVGGRHLQSAERKVPSNWGIITIQSDHVIVNRPAHAGNPDCASQLGALWKLELTNLLIKTGLPLYTYKSKQYIIDQIVQLVDHAEIKRHVAYELMCRDYAQFDAKDYSLHFGGAKGTGGSPITVNGLPAAEIVDALSEQNFGQMTLDQWIALYAQAKELQRSKEKEERCLVQAQAAPRTPHDIPYTEIEVSLGVPWVREGIINDFTYFLRTGNEAFAGKDDSARKYVSYEPLTGYWHVEDKQCTYRNADKTRVRSTYGLPDYNALYILEAALNLREIRRETEEKTVAALEKQEAIEKLFKEWVWQDEDRRWEIEEAYNKLFQGCRAKEYSGRELNFPEMSPDVTLFDYQKDAVMRVISEKNTLLAFDVGAGKTYIMIAAAMKMRQEGKSRKNLFVVPNHIVGQWELIFKQMYPAAKVLSVDPAAFRPQLRQKVLGQIQRGDYDGIIMAYSCFEMIPLSEECLMEQLEWKLGELDASLREIRYSPGIGRALEREKVYIKKQIFDLISTLEGYTETVPLTFDQLEINTLFVDEAHNFKNIPLRSNLRKISGINITGSQKCLEMLHKARYVQESNQGRGVVFATGTPLCNSISDTYAMQMYLQYDKMKETHLDRFDNWVKSFAKPERVCAIDVDTSKYRFVLRFARFFNLPELSRLFSQIAAFHAVDDKEGVPRLERYSDVILSRNSALQSYMDQLCQRSEKIRARKVDRTVDNMLKVSTDGRKAALDLRLVRQNQPARESSKVWRCVQQVVETYKEHDGCSQIIFCDYSTPKTEKFNIYDELKQELMRQGVPSKEIAFIHSCRSEAEKVRLFEEVNRGAVRVLLGSTFKLGIGANVQTRLKAIHHLDVPWRPSDMVQREGRILRRGNQYQEIKIFRYIAEGSFDSYSWQLLETKQRFISQFLSGSEYQRSASDLEENVLTYAQVKALAISQPLMKVLAEKENELRRLRLLSNNYVHTQEAHRQTITEQEKQLTILKERLAATERNISYVGGISEDDFQTAYQNVKGVLTEDVILGRTASPPELSVLGFGIAIPGVEQQNAKKPYIVLSRNGADYPIDMGPSTTGNARRVLNFLKWFHELPKRIGEQRDECLREIERLKELSRETNPYLDQMRSLEEEIIKIRSKIT
ncbi:sce7726 family protein [Flintibacter muris]|uniref:sce7726 family protein n=1 Tax=Flintibacter muris TaxID=2941327 RepID=UPI00203DBDAF|nr:sce7726 family protein [Flintibacter muris]